MTTFCFSDHLVNLSMICTNKPCHFDLKDHLCITNYCLYSYHSKHASLKNLLLGHDFCATDVQNRLVESVHHSFKKVFRLVMSMFRHFKISVDSQILRSFIRSSKVVRASDTDCQCQSRNSPGFNPSICRHRRI